MNAFMNINVRVISGPALTRLRALQTEMRRTSAAGTATGGALGRIGAQSANLRRFGNQLQWTGRQLELNFTLPLLLAAGAATKFALDNEKAMVRVVKVYGDGSMSLAQVRSETTALGHAMVALSNRFGIAQSDAINIAADWAQAGASGIALAKSVEQTMRIMVLGEMDATQATQALISIQAQYGLSTKELANTIDQLNMIENQTGISMQGLVEGFERSAGTARSAGVSTRYLGAMLAAMTPAAGSAAQAGNALKTLLSRIMAPTKDAAAVMEKFGISINSVGWQSLNGAQRLEKLARSWDTLTGSQKIAASATIASRWQINRFDVLMRDMANFVAVADGKVKASNAGLSRYRDSLESTADATKNFKQAQFELDQVLDSNPQRLQIMWTRLQNAMADVIQPLIPYIVYLAKKVADLAQWFSHLSPATQKLVGALVLMLALIGPLIRYIGAWITLFSILHSGWLMVGKGVSVFMALGGAIASVAMMPFRAIAFGIIGIAKTMSLLWTGLLLFGKGMTVAAIGIGRFIMLTSGGLIKSFGALMIQGFALIGRNIAVIWSGAMQRVATLTLIGFERIMGSLAVFAAAMFNTFRMLFINITAIAIAGSKILIRAFSLMFVDILARTKAFFVLMRGWFILGMTSLVTFARTAATGVVAWFTRLPALIWAGLRALGPLMLRVAGLLTGPIGIAITVGATLLMIFWKQIVQFARNIGQAFGQIGQNIAQSMSGAVDYAIRAFYRLPMGVQRALLAVVHIVQQAALAVYRLFSYFNPWAHHSPSLVESVTSGMAAVFREYGKFKSIASAFSQSVRDLQTFKRIAAGLQIQEFKSNRSDVKAAMPQNLGLYDRLVNEYKVLNGVADSYSKQIDKQSAIVAKWDAKLKAANQALDAQQNILQGLQNALDITQRQMDTYKDNITNFANAPIEGMKAFSDAIFENSMAQKKLQLQLLNLGGTDSIDKLRDKYDKLTGDIEVMMGRVADLRSKGAGSEILGPLEQQIAAMRAAQGDITGSINSSPITALQQQLEALQTQAERLDLEQSLKFDPLTRQVDQLVNGMKELPFDEIVNGIKQNQAAVAALQPTLDSQTAAVANQQKVVDSLTQSRDALQTSYDTEKAKLDNLNDAMQKYADQVSSIKSALDELASASAQATSSAARGGRGGGGSGSPGAAAFDAGAMGDFPKVGGNSDIGREGGKGDQAKLMDDFAKSVADEAANALGKIDMFGPIKKKWGEFTGWFGKNIVPAFEPIVHVFDGINLGPTFDKIGGGLQKVGEWAEKIGKLFLPDIRRAWDDVKGKLQKGLDTIWPELKKFADLWDDLKKAAQRVGAFFGGELLMILKIIASIFSNVIGRAIDGIIDLIGDLIRIIRGIVEVVVGVLSGDWAMAWQGIQDIVGGTFEAIWHIIETAGSLLWGVVKGIVEGIVGFFQWLYDIIVGHSIVPDLMKAIIEWFNFLIAPIQKVLDWLAAGWNVIKSTWNTVWTAIKTAFSTWWAGLKAIAQTIWDWFTGVFGTVIDKVKSAWSTSWEGIKSFVTGFWPRFKSSLQTIYDWIKDTLSTAIDKVKDAFTKSWNALGDWFKNNGKKALEPLSGAINFAIDGVNALIRGLNKVSDVLPGMDWSISLIPHFASGGIPGRRVGNGFMTTGARAIVGEGKRNHPEFVIPTDPTYRNRAKALYEKLGQYLGVEQFAGGGIIGAIGSAIGNAADFVKGLGDKAKDAALSLVSDIMSPIRGTVNNLVGRMNWPYGEAMVRALVSQVFSWVSDADQAIRDKVREGAAAIEKATPTPVKTGKHSVGGRAVLFDTGGWLKPGMTNILNNSGRPEPVFNTSQWAAIKNGGLGANSLHGASVSMLTVDRAIIRAERLEVASVRGRNDGPTELHFHGDLSFPNIKSGEDADVFLKNLKSLAGGAK